MNQQAWMTPTGDILTSWAKSAHSAYNGNCLCVLHAGSPCSIVHVTDSKHPRDVLSIFQPQWAEILHSMKDGDLDWDELTPEEPMWLGGNTNYELFACRTERPLPHGETGPGMIIYRVTGSQLRTERSLGFWEPEWRAATQGAKDGHFDFSADPRLLRQSA